MNFARDFISAISADSAQANIDPDRDSPASVDNGQIHQLELVRR